MFFSPGLTRGSAKLYILEWSLTRCAMFGQTGLFCQWATHVCCGCIMDPDQRTKSPVSHSSLNHSRKQLNLVDPVPRSTYRWILSQLIFCIFGHDWPSIVFKKLSFEEFKNFIFVPLLSRIFWGLCTFHPFDLIQFWHFNFNSIWLGLPRFVDRLSGFDYSWE